MIGFINGDIIKSSESEPQRWLPILKEALGRYGQDPSKWEIYRGDGFQLEVVPKKALEACFFIKASIKCIKNLDVRMAIGVGDKTYATEKITESNERTGLCLLACPYYYLWLQCSRGHRFN